MKEKKYFFLLQIFLGCVKKDAVEKWKNEECVSCTTILVSCSSSGNDTSIHSIRQKHILGIIQFSTSGITIIVIDINTHWCKNDQIQHWSWDGKIKSEIDFLRMILVPISSAGDRCNNDLWGSCPATFSFMKYLQTMKEMPCTLAGKQFNLESGERERFNAKEKMPLKSSPCHLPQTIF